MTDTATFTYAGFWRRFNAYGIDTLCVAILCVLASWFIGGDALAQADDLGLSKLGTLSNALQTGNLTPETKDMIQADMEQALKDGTFFPARDAYLAMIISALYNILFVAGKWQATPGKHWLGLIVVMQDGRRLTLLESAIRHIVSGVSMAPSGLGYLTIFFSKKKLALHDMICNTCVIRTEKR
jgi:uncharacterized RDD family membrane protein YckC